MAVSARRCAAPTGAAGPQRSPRSPIVVCVAAGAWTSFGGGNQRRVPVDRSLAPKVAVPPKTAVASSNHVAMPKFVRGVHISLGIAASPTKMNQFINLTSKGLNTLEIDVKDENGEVGYTAGAPALARRIGATRNYYDARKLIADAHAAGIYVIGRIVCFEDPILSNRLPAHAIRTTSGGVWKNASGLGWTNEYDPFVWNYLMSLSKSAAKMGFDEIQYDYVRFPTDGDIVDRGLAAQGRRAVQRRRSTASSSGRAPRSSRWA